MSGRGILAFAEVGSFLCQEKGIGMSRNRRKKGLPKLLVLSDNSFGCPDNPFSELLLPGLLLNLMARLKAKKQLWSGK